MTTVLIRQAELLDAHFNSSICDVRIKGGLVAALGDLTPGPDEQVLEGAGDLFLPGLHDHHVHLASFAASLQSVRCGPPAVSNEAELASALANAVGSGWIRGIGFHESVLQGLDRHWLDRYEPDRPVRIQHRTGRLWILNSTGLQEIAKLAAHLAPHEASRLSSEDGRLYDVDELLSSLTRQQPPDLAAASRQLAAWGVTGINDMTPSNDNAVWQWFSQCQANGEILQKVRLSGRPELSNCTDSINLEVGETKIHLHDTDLPDFAELVETIVNSHKQNRHIAIHCVTEVELVFALSAFRAAGSRAGDRIEHASVVPPGLVEQLRELKLTVVTQPNFISERGDAYLDEIPENEHDYLYRVNTLIQADIPVAFGTDLPFGTPNPWLLLQAATDRRTKGNRYLGPLEKVSTEEAISRLLGSLHDPSLMRTIEIGMPADCILANRNWASMQSDFTSTEIRATLINGQIVYPRD